jgi:1-acyl-sn-glycerol-3-phosphate acyltransferase
MAMYHLGDRVPQRGNLFSKTVGAAMLKAIGWRVVGDFPNVPKAVMVVVPHTSNFDAYVALAATWAIGLDITMMVKHTVFVWPFGPLLHGLGFSPVNREDAKNLVGVSAQKFREADKLIMGIAPEGTRHSAKQWKSGFMRIALEAGVPVIMTGFDYRKKQVIFLGRFDPTGDIEGDIPKIIALFKEVYPRIPERLSEPLKEIQQKQG